MRKFILEERFILNEASIDQLVQDNGTAENKSTTPKKEIPMDNGHVDWDAYYKTCKVESDFIKFWKGDPSVSDNEDVKNGYYRAVWGNKSDQVSKLGMSFTKSLLKFGWTAKLNPFVNMLQLIFQHKPNCIVTAVSFESIFEANEFNKLTELDLRGQGRLKLENLIFWPAFHQQSNADMKKYLTAQATLCYNWPFKTNNHAQTLCAIMDSSFKIEAIKDVALGKIAGPATKPTTLRPVTQVAALIKELTGVDHKEESSNTKITQILEQVTDKQQALMLLAYLVRSFRQEFISTLQKADNAMQSKLFTSTQTVSYTEEHAKKFDKLIGLYSTNYSKEDFYTLVLGLAEKAGLPIKK